MSQRVFEKNLGDGIVAYVVASDKAGLCTAVLWDEDAEEAVNIRVWMTLEEATQLCERGFRPNG